MNATYKADKHEISLENRTQKSELSGLNPTFYTQNNLFLKQGMEGQQYCYQFTDKQGRIWM